MKYIVTHPKGNARAILVCIKNQMPFIFNSAKEVVLTAPTKIGIDPLIKAGAMVAKPDRGEICVLDSQQDDDGTAQAAPDTDFQPTTQPAHGILGHISKWFHQKLAVN